MTEEIIIAKMLQRRGSAAAWAAANPVLKEGEIGYETDTKKFKFGDGASVWSRLSYAGPGVQSRSKTVTHEDLSLQTAFPLFTLPGGSTLVALASRISERFMPSAEYLYPIDGEEKTAFPLGKVYSIVGETVGSATDVTFVRASFFLRKHGSPTQTISVGIYNGATGELLHTFGTLAASALTESFVEHVFEASPPYHYFSLDTIMAYALSVDSIDADNYVEVEACFGPSQSGYYWDGAQWVQYIDGIGAVDIKGAWAILQWSGAYTIDYPADPAPVDPFTFSDPPLSMGAPSTRHLLNSPFVADGVDRVVSLVISDPGVYTAGEMVFDYAYLWGGL
jgi:hypothetical protein